MASDYNVQTHPTQDKWGRVLIAVEGLHFTDLGTERGSGLGEEVQQKRPETSSQSLAAECGCEVSDTGVLSLSSRGQEKASGAPRHFAGGCLDVLAAKSCFYILQSLLSSCSQV